MRIRTLHNKVSTDHLHKLARKTSLRKFNFFAAILFLPSKAANAVGIELPPKCDVIKVKPPSVRKFSIHLSLLIRKRIALERFLCTQTNPICPIIDTLELLKCRVKGNSHLDATETVLTSRVHLRNMSRLGSTVLSLYYAWCLIEIR